MPVKTDLTDVLKGESWGELLRHYRFTHNMKQMALAEDLGVTQAMVSRWESNRVQPGRAMQARILRMVRQEDLSAPMVGWRQFIADQPAIAAVLDERGVFETVSLGLARELGCAASELTGLSVDACFAGDLPALFSKLCDQGLFDERIETVESADVYSFQRSEGERLEFPVHAMSWWRRGEDRKPRWILNGARISKADFLSLREEIGGQVRVLDTI